MVVRVRVQVRVRVLLLSGNLIDIGIWIWIWDRDLVCPLCITRMVCDHCRGLDALSAALVGVYQPSDV